MIPAGLRRHREEAVPPIGPHLHQIPSWSVAVIDLPRNEHAALASRLLAPKEAVDAVHQVDTRDVESELSLC